MGTEHSREGKELTVMLPAYGEADNLRILLPAIKKVIQELGVTAEIIVLDAMSAVDDTQLVCLENKVTWLPRQGGNRYGDAVRTGIKASTGEFVIALDSDGSHNPDFIHELWRNRSKAAVIIASRYVPGGVTENPWLLVAMSRVLNVIFKIFVGIPVYDVSNSFRLYRGELLRSIQPTYANFDVLEEILAKLIWGRGPHAISILELPFRFEKRMYGKPKRQLILFGLQFLTALFKLGSLRMKYRKQNRIKSSLEIKKR
ncbi:MAG TPA: glycosyltransferase [Anaerolineales bacterium]|nr:glycosyltransferase [Anaerolineales bacterium]